MKKSKAMQLVKALRSGTYKQGRHLLVDENDCFCVMGVVCNESKTNLEWKQRFDDMWTIGKESHELPVRIQKEYSFYCSAGRRSDGDSVIIGNQRYESLMTANDCGVSFKDLADYIEENYKYL